MLAFGLMRFTLDLLTEEPKAVLQILTVFIEHLFYFRFQDKIAISVVDSQTHSIHLTAAGTGTTIVSDPPMAPTVNLGPILSSRLCTRTFRFTNKGRRSQQIFWTTEGFPHARTRKKQDYNPDDVKYQVGNILNFLCVAGLRLGCQSYNGVVALSHR